MKSKNERGILPTQRRLLKLLGSALFFPLALSACGAALSSPATTPLPGIAWRKTESPLFPVAWPPGADTVWVRYTFAYGSSPANLQDGAIVTRPLAKTEWKAGLSLATQELSQDLNQAGVQGVVPLEKTASQVLGTEPQVSANCLKLSRLPDPSRPEIKELLAYYQTWFKYNGAFVNFIRETHTGFIAWVSMNPQTP